MPINIKVCGNTISIKNKGISLTEFQIEKKKNKKRSEQLLTDEFEVITRKSSEKVDEKKRRSSSSIEKKKERSRRKLMKFEKRYKYLENICSEFVAPKSNQNKSLLEANDSKSTKCSVPTLLELTQQVLQLEEEVNAVLFSERNDYNRVTGDGYETIEFLLKLNRVKKRLLDEFDLNLSDDSRHLEKRSTINDSTSSNGCTSFFNDICGTERTKSVSSRLDEDERMIEMLTEEILMVLKKPSLKSVNRSAECKQMNSSSSTPVLTDIPKIPPSFSRNSLLHRQKPPANLICKQYERLDVDFTIHELSAIYEVTDSDMSKNQTTIASLK